MQYQVLNELTISKQALTHNYNYFSSLRPNTRVAPVLKANAYGHGLVELAKFVEASLPQAPFICVDSLYEAYELHKVGIKKDIFIMGYTNPRNYQVWKKLPFIFSVWDLETLHALEKYQPGSRIHLKLDTGMHRLGLNNETLPEFIRHLPGSNLRVEGVFSHLSRADDPKGKTFTQNQHREFKSRVGELENLGLTFRWKHLSATAGAVAIDDPDLNLTRLGLGFYGYSPFPSRTKEGRGLVKNLRPALTLTSHLAHLTRLNPGDQVGYGGTYIAKQSETIAILPLGYNEGISRILSNQGVFTLKDNTPAPIIGRVSMNMTAIKIPRTTTATVGDPVTLISPDPKAVNSLYQHARTVGTIPYTILTGLHSSIRRRLI